MLVPHHEIFWERRGHSCSKKVGIEFKVIAGGDFRDPLVQLPHCIGGDKGLPKVP